MQGIEIPIGAPLKKLDDDLKGAKDKLKKFSDEAGKAGGSLGDKLTVGSNRAAFALQNLGRVAQDAPFGFIGIQNNLNPLLESFQQLKKETGSTGSALKALGQSLIGPAGLGIALSVVSAGILFYQQYQQRANKETKAAVDFNKELADSILTISQVEREGRKNAAKDLSNLQTLYNATQNVTISQKERLKIADELIKQNPEYLKGFSAEEVIAGKAATAYQKLTSAILAKGLAEAGASNRQKLINQQLEQNVELAKAQEALTTARAKVTSKGQALPGLAAAFESSQISKNFTQANDAVIKLNNEIKNTEKQIALVDSVVTDLINKNGANVLFDPEKPRAFGKDIKSVSDVLKELDVNFKKINADVSLKNFAEANKERIDALRKAINDLISIGLTADSTVIKNLQDQLLGIFPTEKITEKGKEAGVSAALGFGAGIASAAPVIGKSFENIIKTFTVFEQQLNSIIEGGIEQTLAGIGNAIGESLSTGTSLAQNLGATLLSSLSSVLGQLGQLAIATGVAMLGIKFAFKNPLSAIAAGVALVALSGAVRGKVNKISGGIGGGGGGASTGGFSAPVPQSSASISTSAAASSQDFGGGRVVFEISGANLVGVLNRAGAQLRRYGP